jgi:hypothetical protein
MVDVTSNACRNGKIRCLSLHCTQIVSLNKKENDPNNMYFDIIESRACIYLLTGKKQDKLMIILRMIIYLEDKQTKRMIMRETRVACATELRLDGIIHISFKVSLFFFSHRET